MVKRSDNAIAEVDVFMKDGRYAFNQHVLAKDLRDFWRRHKDNIDYICFDIGLTGYFWSHRVGWKQWSRYQYHGGNKPADTIRRPQKIAELAQAYINLQEYNKNRTDHVRSLW